MRSNRELSGREPREYLPRLPTGDRAKMPSDAPKTRTPTLFTTAQLGQYLPILTWLCTIALPPLSQGDFRRQTLQ